MNITDEIKINIHLYVILELAIKSVEHDQKLFESFKVHRPYTALCKGQLKVLNEEFKQIKKALYKQYVKFEKYQCINHKECIYSFKCRGEILPFRYDGGALKEQVERKINILWKSVGREMQHEPTQNGYGVNR